MLKPKPTPMNTEPKPKRTRVIPHEMATAIAENKERIIAAKAKIASAKALSKITEKLLPKLTDDDIKMLGAEILVRHNAINAAEHEAGKLREALNK